MRVLLLFLFLAGCASNQAAIPVDADQSIIGYKEHGKVAYYRVALKPSENLSLFTEKSTFSERSEDLKKALIASQCVRAPVRSKMADGWSMNYTYTKEGAPDFPIAVAEISLPDCLGIDVSETE